MLLSEVHKVLKFYLTTANAERCFPALKRKKTYLQNLMTEERLNNCIVHRGKNDQHNLKAIAKEFINDRRKFYF